MFEIAIPDEHATEALAKALAPRLSPGDCLILSGPLGVGKTRFARALAGALGVRADVTSPTFPIANVLQGAAFPVLHLDAYRLETVREFRDLGLEEYFDGAVTLIEWGEAFAEDFPDRLELGFVFDGEGEGRRVRIAPCGAWTSRLQGWAP